MRNAGEILDSVNAHLGTNKNRLFIVETGCAYTKEIARWVSQHPESTYTSIDLDQSLQLATHKELECEGTARHCTFLTQDHIKHLSGRTWVDVIFLNPPDLQTGLTEFLLAVSTGAEVIVMRDYQVRSALAIRRAKEIGWEFEAAGMNNILRRPRNDD